MRVEIEIWQLVGMVGGLLAATIGAFWTLARMMMAQTGRTIDEKFEVVGKHLEKQDESARRLERDLMDLKAQLPRDYVRREDYTQAVSSIMVRIDAFSLRVENMFNDLFKRGVSRE